MDRVVIFADHTIGYKLVEYLLESEKCDKSFEIVGVFTNKTQDAWWPSISNLIVNCNCQLEYFNNSSSSVIKEMKADYLLLLSWKYKISDEILNSIKVNAINIHYSILPKHRGVYPVNWAIQNGDSITGVSIHLVNGEIDSGKIIAQQIIPIEIVDTSKSLLEKLDLLAFKMFPEVWKNRKSWNKIAREQFGEISYHSKTDFLISNHINLRHKTTALSFINFLRSKTFADKTNAFFIDPVSEKKYYVNLNIIESE